MKQKIFNLFVLALASVVSAVNFSMYQSFWASIS